MEHIVSLIFFYFIICKIYFWKTNLYLFLALLVLNKVHEIFVNIRKYLQIFKKFLNIRIFSKKSKSENQISVKVRSKSQILKIMVLFDLCPPLLKVH